MDPTRLAQPDPSVATEEVPPLAPGMHVEVLESAFSYYIRAIDAVVSRDLDRRMAHVEMARGKGKITALLLIDGYPGIRPSVIAEVLMRDRPATGRIIEQLVAHGLVERGQAEDDQRAQSLRATGKGRLAAAEVRRIIRRQEAEFFDFIAPEDRAHFMAILRRTYLRLRDTWH